MDFQIYANDIKYIDETTQELKQNLEKVQKDLLDEKNIFINFEKCFQIFEDLAIKQSQNPNPPQIQSSKDKQAQLQHEIDTLQEQCKELVLQNKQDKQNFQTQINKFNQKNLEQKKQIEEMQLNFNSTEQRLSQKLEIQEELINQLRIQRQAPEYINELEQQNVNLKLNVANIKSSMEKYQQQQIIDESYFNKEQNRFKKEQQNLMQQLETRERDLMQDIVSITSQRDNLEKIVEKKKKKIEFLKEDDRQNIQALQNANEKFVNFRDKSNQNIAELNLQIEKHKKIIQSQELQLENNKQQSQKLFELKNIECKFQFEVKQIQEESNQRIEEINLSSQRRLEVLEKTDQQHMQQFQEFQNNQNMVINQMSMELEKLRQVQLYWQNQYIPEYSVELRKNKKSNDLRLRVHIFTNGNIDINDSFVYLNDGVYYLQFSGIRKLNQDTRNIIFDGRRQGNFKMNAQLTNEVDTQKNEKIVFKNLNPYKIKIKDQYMIIKFQISKEQINSVQIEQAKERIKNSPLKVQKVQDSINTEVVKKEKLREIDLPMIVKNDAKQEKYYQIPLQYEPKKNIPQNETLEKIDNQVKQETKYISEKVQPTVTKVEDKFIDKYKVEKKYISDQPAIEDNDESANQAQNSKQLKNRTSIHTDQLISASQSQYEDDQVLYKLSTDRLYSTTAITQTILESQTNIPIEQEEQNTKVYHNGDIYIGPLNNNKRDGFGTMKYQNGNIYKGCWKNDYRDGSGKMESSNGEVYDGEWKYDQKHGQGIFYLANGDVFEGVFKYNQKTQNGKLIQKNKI